MKDWDFSKNFGGGRKQLDDDAVRAVAVLSLARIKRIEDICKAMNEGSYQIVGQRIAERMVSDAVRCLRERMR